MLIKRAERFTSNDVTDPALYLSRRELMAGAAAWALLPGASAAALPAPAPLQATRNVGRSLNEPPTKYEHATTYNNFYEFGVDKVSALSRREERVAALRCVEAWSMIIPWIGSPPAALLGRVEPAGSAR